MEQRRRRRRLTPAEIERRCAEQFCQEIKQQSNRAETQLALESVFAINDEVYFGTLLQEGPEKTPILWRIIDKSDDRVLLHSKHIVHSDDYDSCPQYIYIDTYWSSWGSSTIRKWLNDVFYNDAFSEEEKAAILKTHIVTQRNKYTTMNPGAECDDHVFLLSALEVEKYYPNKESRAAIPTYEGYYHTECKDNRIAEVEKRTPFHWWLRDQGATPLTSSLVYDDGEIDMRGASVDRYALGIRPAIWVDIGILTALSSNKHERISAAIDHAKQRQKQAEVAQAVSYISSMWDANKIANQRSYLTSGFDDGTLCDISIGEDIQFGQYWQTVIHNKKEPIDWILLGVYAGRALMVSKKILDYNSFVANHTEAHEWNTSAIRQWLNQSFLQEAFTEAEQETILQTPIDDWDQCHFVETSLTRVNAGSLSITEDKVFLLSIAEACDGTSGIGLLKDVLKDPEITAHAAAKAMNTALGAVAGEVYGWWLRTSCDIRIQAAYVKCSARVRYDEETGETIEEYIFPGLKSFQMGIRPAIWVDVELFEKYQSECYTQKMAQRDLAAALELLKNKDYEDAVVWLQKLAEYGLAEAQYRLGTCYDYAYGVEKDAEKASMWYKKAAEQGNANAQVDLGYNYIFGIGVEIDYEQARYWIEKAVDQGHVNAMVFLGNIYEKGLGVTRDEHKSYLLYVRAAELGSVDGASNVAMAYLVGRGIEQDYVQAAKWNAIAAEKGHKSAQFNLAMQYINGDGVPADMNKAMLLMRKAAANGHPQAVAIMQGMGLM